jgi:hypothetical protein
MCRQKHTAKRHACFNLAVQLNVAEPAQIHAKPRIATAESHSQENAENFARQMRRERHKRKA